MLNNIRLNRLGAGHRRIALYIVTATGILLLAAAIGFILPRLSTKLSVLLLAGIVGLGVVLYLAEKPELSLVLLLLGAFFIPLEISATAAVSVNVVIFIVLVIAGLWIAQGLRHRQIQIVQSRTMVPMLVFLIVAAISWLYGNASWDIRFPRPTNLLFVQAGQYAIFILSFIAYFIAAQQPQKVLRWITFGFIILGALAIFARYGGILGRPFQLVLTDAAGNGSFYVWFTALAASQAIFNRQLKTQWRYGLIIAAILVPLLGFFFSASWTSSWLPPVFVLLFLIWLRSRFSAGFLVGLIVIFVISGLVFRFFDWEFERELSVGGRLILWEAVWNLAKTQPILGLGLTTYHQYHTFIPLLTEHGAWYTPNVNSHNLYLDIFAQMGIVGLAVFVWLAAEIGAQTWRLRQRFSNDFNSAYVAGAFAGLVGTLIASGIAEWMLPFVYNVGLKGFRFSVFIWIFLGGLVILEKSPLIGNKEPTD
ncbi:MAG TPA: O-antigen ligase family protein [candidate division Zixibacteria bacterium]|nr:O-antigen ligase family protein [candidate division Zixibacteria bacterium]